MTKTQTFDRIHEGMAELGMCDATGCAEYRRVFRQWVDAGCPDNIAAFIYKMSNGDVSDERVRDGMDRFRQSEVGRLLGERVLATVTKMI